MHQNLQQIGCRPVVEAPPTFLEIKMDVVLGNAVVAAEMLFGLVPEVLDLVDVVAVLDLNLRF